ARSRETPEARIALGVDRQRGVTRTHPEQGIVAAAAELLGIAAELVEVADRATTRARDADAGVAHAPTAWGSLGHTSSPATKMWAGTLAGSSSRSSATKSSVVAQPVDSTRISMRGGVVGASSSR